MEKAEIVALLKENGIVGCGGAGFPTHAKIDERAKTIIMNCAECEPLLKLHRSLLSAYPHEILSAFYEIGKAAGSTEMVIERTAGSASFVTQNDPSDGKSRQVGDIIAVVIPK